MSEERNPYDNRNHEGGEPVQRDDIYAVAGLLAGVNGQLKDIDRRNVGGSNPHIQASKMDPKQVLQKMVTQPSNPPPVQAQATQQPVPPPQQPPPQQPPPIQHAPTVVAQSTDLTSVLNRLDKLERAVESKISLKFKRGISYSVNSTKIKGEFKDPQDIVDIILSEMSKQSKTITIKLNDTNKNSK